MKKRILPLLLSGALALSLSVPALAVEKDWGHAYVSAVYENAFARGNYVQLADLDTDGTPELLIGYLPGTGSSLCFVLDRAYTYEGGELRELSVEPGTILATDYSLYRKYSTGAYRIEGSYTLKGGMTNMTSVTANYWLDNQGTVRSSDTYTKDMAGALSTYYLGDSICSEEQYYRAYYSRNDGWDKVAGYHTAELFIEANTTAQDIGQMVEDYRGSPALASYSTHKITVDGKPVSIAAYGINGNNYFKLRDLGQALGFQVGWDDATRTVSILTDQPYAE